MNDTYTYIVRRWIDCKPYPLPSHCSTRADAERFLLEAAREAKRSSLCFDVVRVKVSQ